ncbi:hypothetical protein [Paraburkholderia pallida]|uniref:hypothetical protein n=1 Tax=Paraburkholderia pallida TaxID=2547399 RepID=UPI00142FFB5E|nr:hypothetical protein [Paraburkholderia pallida]
MPEQTGTRVANTPGAPKNGWLAVRQRGETRAAGARRKIENGMKAINSNRSED